MKYYLATLLSFYFFFFCSCHKETSSHFTITNIVIDGNSLAINDGYGRYMKTQFSQYRYVNIAIGGKTTIDLLNNGKADTALLNYGGNILILDEATNDIYYQCGGDIAFAHYKRYCYWYKQRHPNTKIILVSPTPRKSDNAKLEIDRQRILSLLRNDFKIQSNYTDVYYSNNDYADVLVDAGDNEILGKYSALDNKDLYADAVHHTDSGFVIRGKLVANGIYSIH